MPRIKEYTIQTSVQGPVETRRATTDDLGYGNVQHFGAAVQDIGDLINKKHEQAEVSDLHVKMSAAQANFSKHLREKLQSANPGDTTLSESFMKDYDDYMGKLAEGTNTGAGKRFFNQSAAAMRADFMNSVVAGQAELAGIKAKQDFMDSVKHSSATVIDAPSQSAAARDLLNKALDAQVAAGMDRKLAIQLKSWGETEIVQSELRGWAELNPEDMKARLHSGQYDQYLSGDLKKQLMGEADQAIRGKRVEAELARAEHERVIKEQQEATKNDFIGKIQTGELRVKDISKSNLSAADKEHYIHSLRARADEVRKPIKTDPNVQTKLFERIHLPDGDPKKIVDENELHKAFQKKQISYEVLNQLRTEMQGKRTIEGQIENSQKQELFAAAKRMLTKSNDLTKQADPEGDENFARFQQHALNEIQRYRKEGKDEKSLFDPDSPDSLYKKMNTYVKNGNQIMRAIMKRNGFGGRAAVEDQVAPTSPTTPAKPPRNPGESAADYLKRIGG